MANTGAPGYITTYGDNDPVTPLQNTFNTQASDLNNALANSAFTIYATHALLPATAKTGSHATVTADPTSGLNGDYRFDGTIWQPAKAFSATWPAGTATPQAGAATNAPPAGTLLIKDFQYVTTGTNANGVASAKILFGTPFPNALLHISMTTWSGSSQNPVINAGNADKNGFYPTWPASPNGSVSFTYEATGW